MKFISILALSTIAFLNKALNTPIAPNSGTLIVNISNVKHREGNVKAVLQDRNNFLTPKFVGCIEIIPTADNTQMVFKDLPVGDYSVAIYHDLNNNNNFDRNWIGYPNEPFAVSNNLKPYKLLMPSFDEAKVTLIQNERKELNINLLNN